MDEYLSTQEKQAENERKDTEKKKEEEFDSISDNEEDSPTTEAVRATRPSTKSVSERILGKRRAETTSDSLIQLDDANEVPLPDNSHLLEESSTQRRSSGRVLKRLRQDGDYVYN